MLRITLTTITLLLASQSLIAQAESFTFYNAKSLVNRDWGGTHSITKKDYSRNSSYKTTFSTVLTLQPNGSWGKGKAFILKVTENGNNKNQTQYEAWKGAYKFYGDSDDADNLVLKIGFVRKYIGRKEQKQIVWRIDTNYERKGIRIDIPLEDKTVPKGNIMMSTIKGFYVDSKGQETIRRYEPSGFLESLAGQGSVKEVYSTEFLELRRTFELDDFSPVSILVSTRLSTSLPPGFKLHCKK